MKTNKKLTPTSPEQTEARAEVIKLGIDIHKSKYVVVRQIDNQPPQSPQSFKPDEFIGWMMRQRMGAKRVVSCYEAGCFGFVLHRRPHYTRKISPKRSLANHFINILTSSSRFFFRSLLA